MHNEQRNAHLIDGLLYCSLLHRSYMFQTQTRHPHGALTRCLLSYINVQHFIVQLMHTTLKNVELLKYFKIKEAAPTCFDLQGNHHQGATDST